MKPLLLSTLMLGLSTGVYADDCDINVDGNVSLKNSILTVKTDANDRIVFSPDYTVQVNGKLLQLDSQQQQWASDYYTGINDAVPVVADLATDAIRLASEAVSTVFTEVLNVDSSEVNRLTTKLDSLSDKVHYSFYAEDGSIQLDSEQFEDGELLGPQFEHELEEAVEDLVMSSMGRIMMAIGSQMLLSGRDTEAFEARMEGLSDNIEQNLEFQGELIEERANALCYQLVTVDEAENNLQRSVAELSALDVFSIKTHKDAM